MRPGNHVASSSPDYTPAEIKFMMECYHHVRERHDRPISILDAYRFLKERGMIREVEEDVPLAVPAMRERPREILPPSHDEDLE